MITITVPASRQYDVVIGSGLLSSIGTRIAAITKAKTVCVVSDSTVMPLYGAKILESLAQSGFSCCSFVFPAGEASKNGDQYLALLNHLAQHQLTRSDALIALGGGVVGDLSGFAASAYMRGIDFYNIPTTLLSQIDSSIGGKTAINFGGVKNIVGAFYQPKKVLIDPDLLKTLPSRQIANGLAEAIKMSLTSDKELFELFENKAIEANLDEIIIRSLQIKKAVVEQDEKEAGLRKILNFGHTVGHGIESSEGMSELYHGECVALGMLPMCGEEIRPRVLAVLKKCSLYREPEYDWDKITDAAFHDKKADGNKVTVTLVNEAGNFELKTMGCLEVIELAKTCLEG